MDFNLNFRKLWFFISLSLLIATSCSSEIIKNIPNASWEPRYFNSIDNLCRKVGLKALREETFEVETYEIRIWVGFGPQALKGYLFRRQPSLSDGLFVMDTFILGAKPKIQKLTPKTNWAATWNVLLTSDLTQLPDETTLPDDGVSIMDGVSYVIEIRNNDTYRTYMYGNPKYHKWVEAKKLIQIFSNLNKEFPEFSEY